MSSKMAAGAGDNDEQETKRARAETTAVGRCWSSAFPDDILAVVYRRMVASPRGRVRFAAVCRSWRAVARAAPPAAALPWLLLEPSDCTETKHLHCPQDGTIVRIQLPKARSLFGGHDGGWVISNSPPLRIVNFFSDAKVALPKNQRGFFCERKLVFSKPPTSEDCILATITEFRGIALCRVGYADSVWTKQKPKLSRRLEDITFCNGELYGLTMYEGDVIKFEIGVNENGEPMVTAEHRLNCPMWKEYLSEKTCYMFDLHGKLAVARRAQWPENLEHFFKVFELVNMQGDGVAACNKHKWMEVMSLHDHALFLGRTFSKAVCVPDDDGGRVERNHIYYSHCLSRNDVLPDCALFLTLPNSYGDHKYYRVDDGKNKNGNDVNMIKSTGYFVDSPHCDSMWIIPSDM